MKTADWTPWWSNGKDFPAPFTVKGHGSDQLFLVTKFHMPAQCGKGKPNPHKTYLINPDAGLDNVFVCIWPDKATKRNQKQKKKSGSPATHCHSFCIAKANQNESKLCKKISVYQISVKRGQHQNI